MYSGNNHQSETPFRMQTDPSPEPSAFAFTSVSSPLSTKPGELLQHARDLIKQGQREEAISVLRNIFLRFPQSTEAGVAKSTLEKAGVRL